MQNVLLSLTSFFASAPNKILRYKWLVLFLLFSTTIFMLVGAITRTSMDMSPDSFLDKEDPSMIALNDFREQFGSDDSVFIVYRAKDGNVFSRRSLQALQQLTNDFKNWQTLDRSSFPEQIDGIPLDFDELNHLRRIQSLSTVRVQFNEGDTLRSYRVIPQELPESDADLEQVREIALQIEILKLSFFSADGKYAALLLQTDFGAQQTDDFISAVDAADVSLDDSFLNFDNLDNFDLNFDEGAVIQDVSFEPVDMLAYSRFFTAVKAIYSNYEGDLEFYAVGTAPLMDFVLQLMGQMAYLGAGVVIIFTLLLWILFRSFSAVLWPVVTIAMSVAWTWGATAWAGVTLSSMIALTSLLIFAVGVADCVHVMSAYFSFRKNGEDHHQALSNAYGKTGLAILITTVTTMAGVLALSFTSLQAMKVFGYMSAIGVAMALFFTIVLLPLLLDVWHPGKEKSRTSFVDRLIEVWLGLPLLLRGILIFLYIVGSLYFMGPAVGGYILLITLLTYIVVNWQENILDAVPAIVAKRPFTIVAIFAAVFFVCLYGTSKVHIDSNIAELTREGSDLRIAYEVVDSNMAGTQSMEIMIDTGVADGMKEPVLLKAIDDFQTTIKNNYPNEVSKSNSLANIVKTTNEVMYDGDSAYFKIPDSKEAISQLLYLFNSANPEDRRALVADDYSRSHITISAYNAGSYQYQKFFTELEEEIQTTFAESSEILPDLQIDVTGTIPLMMRMGDEIAQTQYSSFILALGVISVIMIITLGSIQGGLLAMIPNVIPALLTFGLMGLLGMPLDADTLMIAPVIIGIAVDDTIHFMTHYRMEMVHTKSISLALKSTVREVGQAVMFTTMVLGLGFAILSFSGYLGMAKMGFFGSLAIFVALLCDLFLLPALILIFKPTFGVEGADTTINFLGEPA